MPRREKPLDPDAGPVQQFAHELRTLRAEAGAPTYRTMAARSDYAAATLAQAAAGEKMPSLPVTLAYVSACGGDMQQWEQRWHRLAAADAAQPLADDADVEVPYRGLARFEPGDRERFFGRDRLVADLRDSVGRERVVAVVGPSGSGKSSLLRAGLIPALRQPEPSGRRPAALRIFTPGARPLRYARLFTPADAEEADGGDTVVVVDQFEEVFTLCADPAERAAFIDLILAAREPGSRLRVVIGMRADFFGRCAEHRVLAEALRHTTLLVGPMSPAELREAIVKPAAGAGLIVERDLTARILDEVSGEPGGLPLMSHALLETWRRRRSRALTVAAYEAAGGLRGAIAQTAEAAYTRLPPDRADLARRILLRLITPGEGAQDTRRPVDRAGLTVGDPADTAAVLEHLARARLVTLDDGVVDLAHEALITAWPRLSGWIEQDREMLRLHRRLAEAAATWAELDRDPGALYRGTRLAAAEETFSAEHRAHLTELEKSFLAASSETRVRERRTATRTTRRLRLLVTALSLLVAMALIAAGIAYSQRQNALAAQHEALSRQLAAQSGALLDAEHDLASLLAVAAYRTSPTTEATEALYKAADLPLRYKLASPTDPSGPLRSVSSMAVSPEGRVLAVARNNGAVQMWDTRAGRLRATLTSHSHGVSSMVFSPDERTLATGSEDGTARLWDVRTHRTRRILTGHKSTVKTMAFSADGRTLATVGGRSLRLWNTSTGLVRKTLTHPDGPVESVAFSADGRTLATGSERNGTVRLWNTSTGRVTKTFTGHKRVVGLVSFSPDGRVLVTSGSEGTVRSWNTKTGRALMVRTVHKGPVSSAMFSSDGRTVTTLEGSSVRLRDVRTGRVVRTLTSFTGVPVGIGAISLNGHIAATTDQVDETVRLWEVGARLTGMTLTGPKSGVASIAFSPDGRTLATGSQDGTARLWDLTTGLTRKVLTGHKRGVTSVAFSPDGRTLATGSQDHTVRLWDLSTGLTRKVLTGHNKAVNAVTFSPDGRVLATGSTDETVRLWDAGNGLMRKTLTGHTQSVYSAAFSPDGHTLATGSRDHTVRLWNPRTGKVRTVLPGHKHSVWSVAFSPDGHTLATGSGDRTVRLWDPSTGNVRRILTGHKHDVWSVAFSPDGHTLATGNRDDRHMVRLWDTTTGRIRLTLTGHSNGVWPLAFSPDGHTLATGNWSGTVRLWGVQEDQATAMEKICQGVGRELTREERADYLADESVNPMCPDLRS